MIEQLAQARQRRRAKKVGLLIGVVLIRAAIWTIVQSGSLGGQAWQHLMHASPLLPAALLGCVAMILLCTTQVMLILTNRTQPPIRVEFREMLALISAGTL